MKYGGAFGVYPPAVPGVGAYAFPGWGLGKGFGKPVGAWWGWPPYWGI